MDMYQKLVVNNAVQVDVKAQVDGYVADCVDYIAVAVEISAEELKRLAIALGVVNWKKQ